MAGGSIFAGIFGKSFSLSDPRTRQGVVLTAAGALLAVFFLKNPFQGLIWSQILLSLQLPWTIFPLIVLTSSKKVMGRYANSPLNKAVLLAVAAIVTFLNVMLLAGLIFPGGN